MACIAALGCVDFVFPFDEPNNERNIEVLRPKYYVKGGDYTKSDLLSAPTVEGYGGSVVIIPIVEDYSTTRILQRVIDEAAKLREGDGRGC
jgi:D-beta-D-heptose 7-phosphate kinase/D-beta-D-heptose 1-phosphate adenosyltransferase